MELDLGGRKFLFSMLVLVMFFVLVMLGKMEIEMFVSGAIWALGIFAGANALSKFSDLSITKKEVMPAVLESSELRS